MPSPSGFLQALGAAFQGYGQDQQLRDTAAEKQSALDERQRAAQSALEERKRAAMAADQDRNDKLYLQGVRQGTPPSQSDMSAFDQAGREMFNFGGNIPNAYTAMQNDDPARNAPDRMQVMRQSSPDQSAQYLDTYAAPEAVAGRRAELAARLSDARATQAQAASESRQQHHETFLQAQQERALAGSDKGQLVQNGVDAEGKPVYAYFNKGTRSFEPIDTQGITPKDRKGTADGGLKEGRKIAAISEARLADERMRKFEDQMLAGTENISPLNQMAGSLTANLAGSHTLSGAGTQAISEAGLNMAHPTYAQYLRDASTIGRAEQMIMPRGGTETMVRANSLLARAGSGANKATIDASRMARQALFGKAGGFAQTMAPDETARLESSLERIKSGTVGSATHAQQLWDASVAKHGEAKVLAEYGRRP